MDGGLWIIKIEVMLYCHVPFIIFLFRKFGARKAALVTFLLSVGYVYFFMHKYSGKAGEEIARQFPGQFAYFLVGAILYVDKQLFAKLKWIAGASVLLLIVTHDGYVRLFINPIAYGSIVIYFATSAIPSLNFGRYGDFSYGVYLFHFPIIQLLISRGAYDAKPRMAFCISLVSVALVAIWSWRLIESRVLLRNIQAALTSTGTVET